VADSRGLYRAVGSAWHWRDRDAWPDAQLAARLARPEVSVWLLASAAEATASPLGYAELERGPEGVVEICYFGLLPSALGRGLGAGFLSTVCEQAFALGASRVWLHTCTLDHPAALANYEKRGFVRDRSETYFVDLPDEGS
jgi:GNAT superfamily N-acetyltransferase